MTDHRELIESVRAEHLQHVPVTPQGTDSWCYRCRLRWPCDAVRLADALETAASVVKTSQATSDVAIAERNAAFALLATADRRAAEHADWMVERQAVAVRYHTDRADAAERERDELRGHYDAVREQVIVVTQQLAAARKALEVATFLCHAGMAHVSPGGTVDQCANPICQRNVSELAAFSPSPASRGQDPAGGHNAGCPDGAGLEVS